MHKASTNTMANALLGASAAAACVLYYTAVRWLATRAREPVSGDGGPSLGGREDSIARLIFHPHLFRPSRPRPHDEPE